MKRLVICSALAAGILTAGTSQAGGVSIGVSIGGIGIGVSRNGVFVAAPVLVAPPVVYAPPPPPPPVVYAPPVYFVPAPEYVPVYTPVYPSGCYMVPPAPVVIIRRPGYRYEHHEREWRR